MVFRIQASALLLAVVSGAGLFGCSETENKIVVPTIDAPYLLYGSAGGGRALSTVELQLVRTDQVDPELLLTGSDTVNIDMFIAGLRDIDLPDGQTPEDLEFITVFDDGAKRPLPRLIEPHVLAVRAPPTDPNTLVPIYDAEGELFDEGQQLMRLETLIENLAVRDPCREVTWEKTFKTERIPASNVFGARALSSGETFLALSATSTGALGIYRADGGNVELFGISSFDPPIMDTEKASVYGISEREAQTADGRIIPAALAMLRGGVIGQIAVWSEPLNRYVDVTPLDIVPSIGRLKSVSFVELDGEPSLCVTGTVIDGQCGQLAASQECSGGAWCRTESSGEWKAIANIDRAASLTTLIARDGLPPLTLGLNGALFQRVDPNAEPDRAWRELFVPAVNQSCDPACAVFNDVAVPSAASGDLLAVAVGTQASTSVVRGTSVETLSSAPIAAVTAQLFGDERAVEVRRSYTKREAVTFLAATIAPDGSLWLATNHEFLVRVSPGFDAAERICLPEEVEGAAVTALAARADGKLIVVTSPPRVAVTAW